MFKLELDLVLHFIPPMDERGQGIRLTRSLKLPFPPTNGLHLAGVAMDDPPSPLGFRINDLTWDLDRQVFMATTQLIDHNLPLAAIPDEIANWIERGWRLGSYEDAYEQPEATEDDSSEIAAESVDEWDEDDRLPTMNPRSRPLVFNQSLRALVREMARLHNNEATAYAIDRTKMFFREEQLKGEPKAAIRFCDARKEFLAMTWDQQCDWREKVLRTHPRLDRIVAEVSARDAGSASSTPTRKAPGE
jgi:hypothetical protein